MANGEYATEKAQKDVASFNFWEDVVDNFKKRLSPQSKILDVQLVKVLAHDQAVIIFHTKAGRVENQATIFQDGSMGKEAIIFTLPSGRKFEIPLNEVLPKKSGN